jgi:large subunit ribosomal protein L35
MEKKMPKMKTKSSAKKRFSVTASGQVRSAQANKRHNMRKRSKRQLRDQRGTNILCQADGKMVLSYMPYNH